MPMPPSAEWMNAPHRALRDAARLMSISLTDQEAYFLIRVMTDQGWLFLKEQRVSITCPRCEMTSHNPNDIRYGYCGYCHDFTRVS